VCLCELPVPDVVLVDFAACLVAVEWQASSEGCFLKSSEGSKYMDLFQRLRLIYLFTDYSAAVTVENDHILPRGKCIVLVSIHCVYCTETCIVVSVRQPNDTCIAFSVLVMREEKCLKVILKTR